MSFSSPATYSSKANSGYLSEFLLGSSASPPIYTAILEIKSFTLDALTMPEIPTTHLLSILNTEEFIPGMIKPGKVTASGNFIGDATQLQITTLAQAQTIFPFQVVAPLQRLAKTYTFQSFGFIVGYKPGPFENNKAIEFSVDIQLTGAYTETVA
jgi:hypothetical protein